VASEHDPGRCAASADGFLPREGRVGEFDLGETVSRVAVVTVHFDDPNPRPAPEPVEDTEASNSDMDLPQVADDTEGTDAEAPEAETAQLSAPPVPIGPRVVATLKGPSTGASDPPVSIQIAVVSSVISDGKSMPKSSVPS